MDLLHRVVWEYENKTRSGRHWRGHYVNETERQSEREKDQRERVNIVVGGVWDTPARCLSMQIGPIEREPTHPPTFSHSLFLSLHLSRSLRLSHQLSLCFNLSLPFFPRKTQLRKFHRFLHHPQGSNYLFPYNALPEKIILY